MRTKIKEAQSSSKVGATLCQGGKEQTEKTKGQKAIKTRRAVPRSAPLFAKEESKKEQAETENMDLPDIVMCAVV